jgi:DNA-binding MarR family transcriptional regulator
LYQSYYGVDQMQRDKPPHPTDDRIPRRGGVASRISKHQGEASGAQRPPLESAELQAALGFRLRVAWGAMERYFFECFQAEKIAPATYAILVLVAANPGCLASEICAITAISSANIIPYIDELVERGLIRREVGARDRRVKHLYLTDEGASHLVALRRLEKRVVAHFEKKLGAQNLSKLIEWLGILAEND